MSRYWSSLVSQLSPYVPGEQPKLANLVKLNTNEHPLGPSPKVLEAIRIELEADAGAQLRLYPDPESTALRQALARRHGLGLEQVFVGNGSDEVLAFVFQGLFQHERPLLFPDITYSFYPVYAGLYQIEVERVPLRGDFTIAVDDYLRPAGGVIFPNPNAPTGCLLALEEIERLCDWHRDRAVVVIDEAYIDFAGGLDDDPVRFSAVSLLARHPNLLITQTFSKGRALAGLRVGMAFGSAELIEALVRVKDSFNSYPLDRLAQVGALAAWEDEAWFDEGRRQVVSERQRLTYALELLGFFVLPSAANFVLARPSGIAAAELAQGLRAHGVVVRHFGAARVSDYLRITVGRAEQHDRLLAALQALLA